MFNNIIYFIIVLLIFNLSYPDARPEGSLPFTLLMMFVIWVIFSVYSATAFGRLKRELIKAGRGDPRSSSRYERLNVRLSILAIFLFALATYLFELRQWLHLIPGFDGFSVLEGIIAISLFLFYLSTIWYFACPVYRLLFQTTSTRRSFVYSNLRFNLPILFPWVAISLVYDLLALSPWAGHDSFLNSVFGQIVFFAAFIILLMVFMPKIIQTWWGCKPLTASEKGRDLEVFLRQKGFKYRRLLRWPIFEGRMMTAGIMGIVSRYRYILVTDSLLKILSIQELKAVLAHEIGHAKYRHLLIYVLFLIGFMVLSLGLSDLFLYLLYAYPTLLDLVPGSESTSTNLSYLVLSLPMLVILLVYFRFIMGFFMRHFERQADLFSATTMGTPMLTISSLEKIALVSGKGRDHPSWHHFSIKQRVDCLLRTLKDPKLFKRHNRFVLTSLMIYLVCICSLGYLLNFGPVKREINYMLLEKMLNQQLMKEPHNIATNLNLAIVYQQMGRDREATDIYGRVIDLDPNRAVAFNNLAWLLVTTPDEGLRDSGRAIDLARRAVALKRSPGFLDTLAEAYYAEGLVMEAVRTIEEAIVRATENRGYYEGQLKRFRSGGR